METLLTEQKHLIESFFLSQHLVMTLTHCCLLEIKIHSVHCQNGLKRKTWYIKIIKNTPQLLVIALACVRSHSSGGLELEFSGGAAAFTCVPGTVCAFTHAGLGVATLASASESERGSGHFSRFAMLRLGKGGNQDCPTLPAVT